MSAHMSQRVGAAAAAMQGARRSRLAGGVTVISAPELGGDLYAGGSPTVTAPVYSDGGAPDSYTLLVDGNAVATGDEAAIEAYTFSFADEGRTVVVRAHRAGVADSDSNGVTVWSMLNLSTLRHWYRGDAVITAGGAITTQIDKKGSANLVQATAEQRPTYSASITSLGGRPGGIYVAGSAQYLRTAAVLAVPIPQPFTVVLAWSHSALTAATYYTICGGSLGDRWFIRAIGPQLQVYGGTMTAAASLTLATDTAYTGVFVFNGGSSKIRVNGASVYAGQTNIGASDCDDVTLGREQVANYFSGAIGEVAILTGDLTANAGDLAQVEAYLAAVYR